MGEKLTELDEIFSSPSAKIIIFLAEFDELDFNISDISRNTGINRKTASKNLKHFLKYRVVIISKRTGHIKLYKLNKRNFLAKKMLEMVDEYGVTN